jgi:hypothetical protein
MERKESKTSIVETFIWPQLFQASSTPYEAERGGPRINKKTDLLIVFNLTEQKAGV